MTEARPAAHDGPVAAPVTPDGADAPGGEPVATLRGAGVGADTRRVGAVAVALVAGALLVLVVAFAVAGAEKNDHITRLRQQGVPVEATVTGCTGLLGGSGSNGAGYACHGTYRIDGRQYQVAIPGNVKFPPGTRLPAVTVLSDPSLFTTVRVLASEHASVRVYLLPALFLVLLLLVVAAVVWHRRTRRRVGARRSERAPD
jgi:hypothetical protein